MTDTSDPSWKIVLQNEPRCKGVLGCNDVMNFYATASSDGTTIASSSMLSFNGEEDYGRIHKEPCVHIHAYVIANMIST